MLTAKQPVHYGYKSVHDLPTPPSTSRPSPPPLVYQDEASKRPAALPRSISPASQPMSGPHRGLPPPAAMTLAQPPSHGSGPPPPPPAGPQLAQVPAPPHASHHQSHMLGQLPPPPQWQQTPDDSIRAWLLAKAEEEKRRQEEEKTRQETLRLEQRRTEHEILRTSLQGGIPPPMVPVVFAGMGGNTLPQAALEWAQQYMYLQGQPQQPSAHQPQQLLTAAGHISPEHRRDSQQSQPYGAYPPSGGVPPTPGSAQGSQGGFMSQPPGSPARPRGYSMPGSRGQPAIGSNLPALNTNMPQGGPGGAQQPHPSAATAQAEQAQSSPSIYFHHWHPPASQTAGSGSTQPPTPSEKLPLVGESPRKRKATGPQPAAPPPNIQQRLRSPPFSLETPGSTLSNPPPGRRRGHSRQRSDLSLYRPTGRGNGNGNGGGRQEPPGSSYRGASPGHMSAPPTSREGDISGESSRQHQLQEHHHQAVHQPPLLHASQPRSGPHSVSSLLSEEPSPRTAQYHSAVPEIERRDSPGNAGRGGPMRPRDNE